MCFCFREQIVRLSFDDGIYRDINAGNTNCDGMEPNKKSQVCILQPRSSLLVGDERTETNSNEAIEENNKTRQENIDPKTFHGIINDTIMQEVHFRSSEDEFNDSCDSVESDFTTSDDYEDEENDDEN